MATQPLVPDNDSGEPEHMDDDELAALLSAHETRSIGYYDSEIAAAQAKAIDYYMGRMADLPALEGCSQVIDHTVAVMVDNGLAAVLKPFVSAEEVVVFDPVGPEDVEMAEQATEYVNYVIHKDNDGFLILHNWFKDALLTKIGVVKVWWEDKPRTQQVQADPMQLLQMRQDENYASEEDNGDGTFTVTMTVPDGRERICGVPPEEILVSPAARDVDSAPYLAHKPSNFTRSDLVAMGFDREIIDNLPAYARDDSGEVRRQARYQDQDWFTSTEAGISGDKSRDVIAVLDEFVRVDYDGDGIAELRRVVRVDDVILFNEEIEDAPLAFLCPVPLPHRIIGLSTADQAVENQKVLTAITRQTLDNLYKSNNPRPVVPDTALNQSTMDNLTDSSPGASISVKAPGQLEWQVVPFTADASFPLMEAMARNAEERTGFRRKGNGFNAEALNKNSPDTATEAAIDENSQNERAELIARIFAETGVKRLFRLILKDLIKYQPQARIIRLRNKFVQMDPSGWNPEMDVTISVGLGMGNKMEQIGQADSVLQTMAELEGTQYAYLINAENVHNALKRKFTAAGIKNVDDYLVDPKTAEAPEAPQDPEMAKVQQQGQIEQMKAQMKMQADQAEAQRKAQSDQVNFAMQAQRDQTAAQLAAMKAQSEAQLAQAKADFEAQLALAETRAQIQLEREKLANERELGHAKVASAHEVAISKNRKGGKLDE